MYDSPRVKVRISFDKRDPFGKGPIYEQGETVAGTVTVENWCQREMAVITMNIVEDISLRTLETSLLWYSENCTNVSTVFRFPLSPDALPSLHGLVSYQITVQLGSEIEHSSRFQVIAARDLNLISQIHQPISRATRKGFILSSKRMTMAVHLPKQGFNPGEPIPFVVHLKTNKPKLFSIIEVALEQCNFISRVFKESTQVAREYESEVEVLGKFEMGGSLITPTSLTSGFQIRKYNLRYFFQVSAFYKGGKLICRIPVHIGRLYSSGNLFSSGMSVVETDLMDTPDEEEEEQDPPAYCELASCPVISSFNDSPPSYGQIYPNLNLCTMV